MKWPRISVGAVMFGLVIVAIDCVIYRSVNARPESMRDGLSEVVLGTLPMANLLSIILASLIGCRAEARASRVGFVVGAGLALVATIFGLWPTLFEIASVMQSTGLGRWLMGSPIREMVAVYVIVVGFSLLIQVVAGLIGGWIGRRVDARWARVRVETSRPDRFRLASMVALMVFVAAPALGVEGYLRNKVDPQISRLAVGSKAVVDFNESPYNPTRLPKNSRIRQFSGASVRVEADREPYLIEQIMLQYPGSKATKTYTHDLRQVQVTLLNGPRAGESTTMYHCFLRVVR